MLVIDHRETQVRMNGRALRIERPEHPPEHVPLGLIGLVVVHGSPMVGCEVWRELAERNIPAVLQPARGRGAGALVGAALGGTIELRIAQHRAADSPETALAIARRLVAAKIDAQTEVAARLAPAPEGAAELQRAQREAVDGLGRAVAVPSLLGVEGAAAAAWYHWLIGWLDGRGLQHWRFAGRNRRPPRDPINALLSLGYTLLAGEVLRAVQEQGLDPALGFLHGVVPGRESLVLDLMEPLRPSVDLVVLGLADGVLIPTQFAYSARDGCRLTKDARALFYREWAMARSDWPDLSRPLTGQPGRQGGDPGAARGPGPGDSAGAPSRAPMGPGGAEGDPDTGAGSPAQGESASLPALCRRQVERLRAWLRPKSE
jgi:CRISPR-associated protein Cas1